MPCAVNIRVEWGAPTLRCDRGWSRCCKYFQTGCKADLPSQPTACRASQLCTRSKVLYGQLHPRFYLVVVVAEARLCRRNIALVPRCRAGLYAPVMTLVLLLLPQSLMHHCREAIISQVPEMQGGFVRVPKISTGADGTPSSSVSSMDSSSVTSSSSSMSSSDDEGTPAAAAAASGEITEADLTQLHALDIRVGKVISCEPHPDADR